MAKQQFHQRLEAEQARVQGVSASVEGQARVAQAARLMMPDAARVGDMHTCPLPAHVGGPIDSPGSPDIEIEGKPAARTKVDHAACAVGGPDVLNMGCPTVIFNNQLAVRKDDLTAHGGTITTGAGTVEIGVAGDGIAVGPIGGSASSKSKGKKAKEDSEDGKKTGNEEVKGDKGGQDGKGGDSEPVSSEEVDPIADFELFDSESGVKVGGQGSYDALIRGRSYRAVSKSFDPDDGNGSVPDEGITQWSWIVEFIGSPASTVSSSEPSSSFTVPNSEEVRQIRLSLAVTDNDSRPRSNSARRTILVRSATKCDLYKDRVKELSEKLASIYTALKDRGFVWSPIAYNRWRAGMGGELVYDASWFRSYGRVRDAEEELNQLVSAAIQRETLGLAPGTHRLYSRDRSSFRTGLNVWYKFLEGDDLAASWGSARITAEVKCALTIFQDGSISGQGTVSYEAQDRYNWNPNDGLPIPLVVAAYSGHCRWEDNDGLLLEDCLSPKPRPFDNRARWSRSVSLNGTVVLDRSTTEYGMPRSTGPTWVVGGIPSFDMRFVS